jgi:hypothetical protein
LLGLGGLLGLGRLLTKRLSGWLGRRLGSRLGKDRSRLKIRSSREAGAAGARGRAVGASERGAAGALEVLEPDIFSQVGRQAGKNCLMMGVNEAKKMGYLSLSYSSIHCGHSQNTVTYTKGKSKELEDRLR